MNWNALESYRFEDRMAEHPSRYKLTDTDTQESSIVDFQPSAGNVPLYGTVLRADNLDNNINAYIHRNIQSGDTIVQMATNVTQKTIDVTFPIPFKKNTEPIVVANISHAAVTLNETKGVVCYVANETNEGFKIIVERPTATGYQYIHVSWIAVGQVESIHTRRMYIDHFEEETDVRTGVTKTYMNVTTYYDEADVAYDVDWLVDVSNQYISTTSAPNIAAVVFKGDINRNASDGGIVEVFYLNFYN